MLKRSSVMSCPMARYLWYEHEQVLAEQPVDPVAYTIAHFSAMKPSSTAAAP